MSYNLPGTPTTAIDYTDTEDDTKGRAAIPTTKTRVDSPFRLRVVIRGAVQGVGFRPFIYRLATDLGLVGWVNNSSQGVFVEVEGEKSVLDQFLVRIEQEKPPRSFIQSMEPSYLDPVGFAEFEIRPSEESGKKVALILPDIAICDDCLREIFDPTNRRYLYPFTNCTNCGPRFTIIKSLPYDRPNTTMGEFVMCEQCRAEYENPLDRRFHAQPNACPNCGPHVELWTHNGGVLSRNGNSFRGAVMALRDGEILAVKGLGGFHLMVDAGNEEAVAELRRRKHREEKPFALMYPNMAQVKAHCEVSALEERLLRSPEAPIVLLRKKCEASELAPSVAPRNPYLGVMLPYTPLHHILMAYMKRPVVATSGNLSDEPICIDQHDALKRLGMIADRFLVHNRPIERHADDSIARIVAGREMVVRRARGYAPLPIRLKESVPPTLAVGAHLKNSVALSVGQDVFVSQHIGDLETEEAYGAFRKVIDDFERLYEVQPEVLSHDAHPEYLSTQFAMESSLPVTSIQHHIAHVYSCMAENELDGPVLGVSWDGTGYGLDGTIWGGEFFVVGGRGSGVGGQEPQTGDTAASGPQAVLAKRVAHLRTFRLPGGDKAVKEPRRSAVGLLHEILGDRLPEMRELKPVGACTPEEVSVWQGMVNGGVNAPVTSSAGRLFDAVASIVGLQQVTRYEGQAAMALEFALTGSYSHPARIYKHYNFSLIEGDPLVIDWAPTVEGILSDMAWEVRVPEISAKFHNTLVEMIIAVARRMGVEQVCLTGGCFQNKYLTERAVHRLREAGFRPYWHQRVPPNDGGIALGQVAAAARVRAEEFAKD